MKPSPTELLVKAFAHKILMEWPKIVIENDIAWKCLNFAVENVDWNSAELEQESLNEVALNNYFKPQPSSHLISLLANLITRQIKKSELWIGKKQRKSQVK